MDTPSHIHSSPKRIDTTSPVHGFVMSVNASPWIRGGHNTLVSESLDIEYVADHVSPTTKLAS